MIGSVTNLDQQLLTTTPASPRSGAKSDTSPASPKSGAKSDITPGEEVIRSVIAPSVGSSGEEDTAAAATPKTTDTGVLHRI